MALREPFDIPCDSTAFLPGTKYVTMQEDYEHTPGNGQIFYLSQRFTFAEGTYNFKATADNTATIWVGQDQASLRMILSTAIAEPNAADDINVYLSGGVYRVDVLVQNMEMLPSVAYFALNITLNDLPFYLSSKTGWLLDDGPINDADLPPVSDPRLQLPMFTVLPNWQNGIIERLAWQTDVMSSESDAEQRRSVRRDPRRYFEAAFLRGDPQRGAWQRTRLDNFFVGVGHGKFMMPLWHEGLDIITGITVDSQHVIFEGKDGHMREFREDDLVFVNNGNPDDYDILTAGAVTDLSLTWATPPLRAWPPGTRIYPMRMARIVDDPQLQNNNDSVVSVQVRFDQIEPDVRPPSWGTNQNGQPFLRMRPNYGESVTTSYSRKGYTLDNESGRSEFTDSGRYSTSIRQFQSTLHGREQTYAFRQFMAAARGRARHFYAPTFNNDMQLLTDVIDGDLELFAKPTGYVQYMARPQPLRLTLMIDLGDNVAPLYRQILSVAQVYRPNTAGNTAQPKMVTVEVFTLDIAMPPLALSDIHRISFVTETRFDQDMFELHHPVNGQKVVTVALTLRQAQNPRSVTT